MDVEKKMQGTVQRKTKETEIDLSLIVNGSGETTIDTGVPFLDHRLVEFVLGLPFNFKSKGGNAKFILKKMSEKLIPNEIIYRKKHPFFLPLTVWIKDDFKDLIKDTFNSSFIRNNPLFNQAGLNNLLNDHISNSRDHSWEIWLSFITIRWLENNINN